MFWRSVETMSQAARQRAERFSPRWTVMALRNEGEEKMARMMSGVNFFVFELDFLVGEESPCSSSFSSESSFSSSSPTSATTESNLHQCSKFARACWRSATAIVVTNNDFLHKFSTAFGIAVIG